MSTEHKYVRHSVLGFILFPTQDILWHKHIGVLMRQVSSKGDLVSAGFARIEGGDVICYGESESLKMRSKAEDSDLLAKQLGLDQS